MRKPWVLFSLLAVLCAAPMLTAQVATGNITGRITDPTGAVVAGVDVTATNPAKGFTTRASSDEQGVYRLLYLEPATYTLTFRQIGLTTLDRSGVVLRSNDTLSVDVQLSVGAIVEKVEVTAATPLLETATSTTGTVMSGMQLTTLPQTQRWTYFVMYLLPGVTSISGFHISGQRDRGVGLFHGRHLGPGADPGRHSRGPDCVHDPKRDRRSEAGLDGVTRGKRPLGRRLAERHV